MRFDVTVVRMLAAAAMLGALGCAATAKPVPAPEVPPDLRPPSGEVLFLDAHASGVQIYECVGRPDGYAWVFRAPEAVLADGAGHALGKHYAGPTWESSDGSSVVGEVKAHAPAPGAGDIPWLLVSAKSTTGSGVFTPTTSIQRLDTKGGVAPLGGCGAASDKQLARVPYTATYYFYRAPKK
jgi:hypothetical protein